MSKITMKQVDKLNGHQFEIFTGDLLSALNFVDIHVTPASNDFGLDVIAKDKYGTSYGIQCKHFKGDVGYHSVEEATGGRLYYDTDKAVVFTNSYFSHNTQIGAHKDHVELWNRDTLKVLLNIANNTCNFNKHLFDKPKYHKVRQFVKSNPKICTRIDDDLMHHRIELIALIWIRNHATFGHLFHNSRLPKFYFFERKSISKLSKDSGINHNYISKLFGYLRSVKIAYIHYGTIILSPELRYKGSRNKFRKSMSFFKKLIINQNMKMH